MDGETGRVPKAIALKLWLSEPGRDTSEHYRSECVVGAAVLICLGRDVSFGPPHFRLMRDQGSMRTNQLRHVSHYCQPFWPLLWLHLPGQLCKSVAVAHIVDTFKRNNGPSRPIQSNAIQASFSDGMVFIKIDFRIDGAPLTKWEASSSNTIVRQFLH